MHFLHLSLLIDQNMMKQIFLLLNESQGQRGWKCDYFWHKETLLKQKKFLPMIFILTTSVVII